MDQTISDRLLEVTKEEQAEDRLALIQVRKRLARIMGKETVTGDSATEILAQLLVLLADKDIITDQTGIRWIYDTVTLSDSASGA